MRILILVGFLPLVILNPVRAQNVQWPKTLVLNTEHYPPYSKTDGSGFEDLVAKALFRRLGISIELNFLPSERVLINANLGVDDGILARVSGIAKKYTNLVQFEEPVLTRDYVAFARRTDIKIVGWESLRPYHIAIITGWKLLETNIKNTKSLNMVKNAKQLFSVLNAGRADVVVFSRLSGLQIIKQRGVRGVRALDPPLATRKSFFYLHKKHRNLIDPASAALRAMKADGTHQQIYDQVVKPLLPK